MDIDLDLDLKICFLRRDREVEDIVEDRSREADIQIQVIYTACSERPNSSISREPSNVLKLMVVCMQSPHDSHTPDLANDTMSEQPSLIAPLEIAEDKVNKARRDLNVNVFQPSADR